MERYSKKTGTWVLQNESQTTKKRISSSWLPLSAEDCSSSDHRLEHLQNNSSHGCDYVNKKNSKHREQIESTNRGMGWREASSLKGSSEVKLSAIENNRRERLRELPNRSGHSRGN